MNGRARLVRLVGQDMSYRMARRRVYDLTITNNL